jgi:hypothetical protein
VRRTIRVAGPLAPDDAWERYADVSLWSSWAPPIRRVEASGKRLAPGLTGLVHGPAVRVAFVVESVDAAARTWTWRVALGPLRLMLDHAVQAAPGGGSVAALTVTGPAPIALAYSQVARIALHRLVHP